MFRSLTPIGVLLIVSSTCTAGIIAHWRLEDGPVGTEAATLLSQANSPLLDGAEGGTGAASMVFSSDVPNIWIQNGVTGTTVANSLSLYNEMVGNNRFDVDDNTNVPALHEPGSFTYEMFVKADNPDTSSYRVLARKTRGAADGSWFIMANNGRLGIRVDSNDGTTGQFNQGAYSNPATDGSIDDGLWHHIALTYDGTSPKFSLYKDYEPIASIVPGNGGSIVYDGGILHIGGRDNGNSWQGWLDEVRFTDQVLSPDSFLRAVSRAVPEPGSLALLAFGLAMLLVSGGRRRRSVA